MAIDPHVLYIQFCQLLQEYKKNNSSIFSTYKFPASIGTFEPSITQKPLPNVSLFANKKSGYGAIPQDEETNLLSDLKNLLSEFDRGIKDKFEILQKMFLKINSACQEEVSFGEYRLGCAIYDFLIAKLGITSDQLIQLSKEMKVNSAYKHDFSPLIKEIIVKMKNQELQTLSNTNTNTNNNNNNQQTPSSFGNTN